MHRFLLAGLLGLALATPAAARTRLPAEPAIFIAAQVADAIDAFTLAQPHAPLGRIGIGQPIALASDAAGVVYAIHYSPQGISAVVAYVPGQRRPRTYSGVQAPRYLAVGPDGSLYVIDERLNLFIYPPGQTMPSQTRTLDHLGDFLVAADGTLDVATNVCADSNCNSYVGTVFAYPPGATVGTDLGFENALASAAGVTVDAAGNFVVADPVGGSVDVVSPRTLQLVAKFKQDLIVPEQLAFDRARKHLYVVDLDANAVDVFDYARGVRTGTLGRCRPAAGASCSAVTIPPTP